MFLLLLLATPTNLLILESRLKATSKVYPDSMVSQSGWNLIRVLILCLALTGGSAQAFDSSWLEINDEIEIEIRRFGKDKPVGIIWFACNQGDDSVEFATARKLTSQGYQIYFPDMLSAHFLSPLPSNIARVPADEVAQVILHILETSSAERLYLVAGARAAVPLIRGLADARLQRSPSRLKGALLITPRINKKTPEPGSEPVYIDETGRSIHPLIVLEGERTPNRWGLPHLTAALAQSGSRVKTDLIAGVRGYFYLRNDQTDAEIEMTQNLDRLIDTAIRDFGV